MAAAAAKAVWGEDTKEEPLSGVTGNTAKGEPYDAGNMEDPPEELKKPSGPADPSTVQPSADPSATTGTADSTRLQNDRWNPTMMAGGLSGEAPKQVTTTGSGPVSEPSSEKVLGPGPKPIEEVARSHGGDAGKAGSMSSRAKDEDDNSSSSSLSSEDEGDIKNKSQEEIEEAGRRREQRKKNKKGTGQIYIKSTGLQADGGDFDAARAGAGREAERLMAEKGIHRSRGPKLEPDDATTEKGKRSLGEKLMDKLHPTFKSTH